MTAKHSIKIYYDIVSPYSWLGFLSISAYKKVWASLVDVEFVPFYLGGVMQASENQPPGTNRFKAKYMMNDLARASRFFKTSLSFTVPAEFPANSIHAMRILTVLYLAKDDRLEELSIKMWEHYWGGRNGSLQLESLQHCLSTLFTPGQIEKLLSDASTAKVKESLAAQTRDAVTSGAFGAPWFIVTRDDNVCETFFGSDRLEAIAFFLNLPYLGPAPLDRPASSTSSSSSSFSKL